MVKGRLRDFYGHLVNDAIRYIGETVMGWAVTSASLCRGHLAAGC
jgi:hypothetical protein